MSAEPMTGPVDGDAPDGHFRAILDDLLEGCQIIGFDWRYLYVNEAVARQGRKSREELLGRRMMDAYPGIEDTAMFGVLVRCMDGRTNATMQNEFIYADGSRGWFDLRIQPVPEGLFVMSLDITERRNAELSLQRQLERTRSLRAIDLAILSNTDLGHVLGTLIDEARVRLHASAAAVLLLVPDSRLLRSAASSGFATEPDADGAIPLGEGLIGQAALEQHTLALEGVPVDELPHALRPRSIAAPRYSLHATPLVARGDVLGVLVVLHASASPGPDWLAFLETLAGQAAIGVETVRSREYLEASNEAIALAYDATIEGWSRALDLRDRETVGHTRRVTGMTLKLARLAGIDEAELVHVKRGALLHDIGKMGVSDSILLKPGPLTTDEWAVMQQHPDQARSLLYPIEFLRPALAIPYCHHERWDGTGYPRGLKGKEIPLSARLFAVVDVWDALRSDRPYREGWPEDRVRQYLRDNAGTHFDPAAVRMFLEVLESEPEPPPADRA